MSRRVYVIELAPGAGPRRDPRIPWVYVGSSSRDPELRFAQHLRGYRSARLVKRYALRLRPDLYSDIEPIPGYAAALATEAKRARELAACGFVAHSDGTSYGEGRGGWREWDSKRLEPVASFVRDAASELREASFADLDTATCARLLHGDRGFWVQDYLDPADPPPAYGLFSHVSLAALEGACRRARRKLAETRRT